MKENHPVDIEKYIEVFSIIADAVSIQDRDYKVLYQNDVHIGLVGTHTGEYCYKAYEKKSQRCEGCPIATTFEDGGLHNAERSAPVGDSHIHVEITSSPIRDSEGNIIAGVELVRDVSSRKHAEEELDRIFNLTPDMICVAGTDGYFKRLNKAWEKVLGYTIEELLEKPFIGLIHPDDREQTLQEIEKLVSGIETYHFENRFKCKEAVGVIELTGICFGNALPIIGKEIPDFFILTFFKHETPFIRGCRPQKPVAIRIQQHGPAKSVSRYGFHVVNQPRPQIV